MKLSTILEAESEAEFLETPRVKPLLEHVTDVSSIRAILANVRNFIEDDEWIINDDGVVEEASNVSAFDIEIPSQWDAIKVKFGSFPHATYRLVRCQLGTLHNSPTDVKMFSVQGGIRLASLRGGPERVRETMTLVDTTLTSLTGAPIMVGDAYRTGKVVLHKMHKLSSLAGIEGLHLFELDIQECSGLKTLEGMPSKIEKNIFLDDLESLDAVRFPQHVRMGSNGVLCIGSNMAHKLSPTLVTVPGLTEIDWISTSVGYRDDILELFNKYLKLPKTIHTYLGLQTELIDRDLDWMADL